MGLRIGDCETYKFHPPVAERKRSVRKPFSTRRKGETGEQPSRSTKSPASDIRGFIMQIRSGSTSTQTTNYNSVQNSPRASISSGRPPSHSSFTHSIDEEHSRKWWPGRSRRGKEHNKSGRQTPGFLTRQPSLDIWSGAEHKEHGDRPVQGNYPRSALLST